MVRSYINTHCWQKKLTNLIIPLFFLSKIFCMHNCYCIPFEGHAKTGNISNMNSTNIGSQMFGTFKPKNYKQHYVTHNIIDFPKKINLQNNLFSSHSTIVESSLNESHSKIVEDMYKTNYVMKLTFVR